MTNWQLDSTIHVVSSFHLLSHYVLREMDIHFWKFCSNSLYLHDEHLFQFGVNVRIVSTSTVSLNGWTLNRSTSCVQCVDRTGNSRVTQRPWERDNSEEQCVPNSDLYQCVNVVHCVKLGYLWTCFYEGRSGMFYMGIFFLILRMMLLSWLYLSILIL